MEAFMEGFETFLNFLFYSSAFVVAALLATAVFMLLTPLFIGSLKNSPGGKKRSGFHLFTDLEEGQAKNIVRGEQLVRCIMTLSGKQFKRQGSKKSEEHWEIIDSQNAVDENPIADVIWFLRPWANYVFKTTGAVFTGVYPFQRVREYTLERTKMKRHESESDDSKSGQGSINENNITLIVEEDFSDHYRVREFLYPVRVAQADTQDAVSVNLVFVVRARVTNPYKAAFGIDRWEHKLVNLATNATTDYTRFNPLNNVLSAKDDPTKVNGLKNAIKAIGQDTVSGFDILDVDIIDISPNLDLEEKKRLYAEALARPVAEATKLDGAARAAVLREMNKANAEGGEHAIETLRTEAQVRMASNAKGGATIFVGTPEGSNNNNAALLAELQKITQHLKGGTV